MLILVIYHFTDILFGNIFPERVLSLTYPFGLVDPLSLVDKGLLRLPNSKIQNFYKPFIGADPHICPLTMAFFILN